MTKRKLFLGLLLAGVTGTVSAQKLADAQVAIRDEQFDKAKGILQQLISKKPKDAANYFYLGQVYLANERLDSAAYYFQQGATSNPKDKLNQVGLGAIDLENGNPSAAESKFATATTGLGKKDYLPLYYVAKAYIDAPKPEYVKAVEYLDQAKQKNAKDPLLFVALGDAYQGLRDGDQAFYNYREAASLDDNLLSAKIGQAVIGRWSQAYDYVIEQLTGLIAANPNYAPLYRELAETYYYSSRQAEESEYREINQKAVEAYRKYLSLAGENSVEAQVRYADFLVYSANYQELKEVAQRLSGVEGVDAKVYRYLGNIAFSIDQDYAKARQDMETLFAKVPANRLISRDYLVAGLSELIAGDQAKGNKYLEEAIARQGEDDNVDADIGETAFAKYLDGETAIAAKIFNFPASNPKSDYYFDANFYLGSIAYTEGSKLYIGSGDEVTDLGVANLQAARPSLEKAIKSFDIVINSGKEEVLEKYQVDALYYKGLAELALDNLQHNPEASTGLFVGSLEKLIGVLNNKEERSDKDKGFLVDSYTYLGFLAVVKGQNEKAKASFNEVLKIDPENENAKYYLSVL